MPRHKWEKGYHLPEESMRRRVESFKATMAARGNPCLRGPITDEEKAKTSERSKLWFAADPSRREASRERMTALAKSKKGQKQTPEQISKRRAAWLRTYEAKKAAGLPLRKKGIIYKPWDAEKKRMFGEKTRARFALKKIERTIICENCGESKVKINIVQLKQKKHFCKQACYNAWQRINAAADPGKLDRRSKEYSNWRRRVVRRDKNNCRNCSSSGKVHAHHILGWAKFPQFRFDTWNGKTLCRRCHALVHRGHEFRAHREIAR